MEKTIKALNLFIKLFNFGLLFWVIETAVFIIEYGWHYYPANSAEKICDNISESIICLSVVGMIGSIALLVKNLFDDFE